jgi:hypothetical protein
MPHDEKEREKDMDADAIVKLIEERPWILVAAVVIGLLGRLVKDDVKGVPNVPPRWRVWLVIALGVLSGLVEKKWGHGLGGKEISWIGGVVGGLLSAALAIVGHNTIIASLRGGKEIPVPWLTKIGVPPAHGKPPSIPPPPETKKDVNN